MSQLTVSAYVKMLTGAGIQITRAMELTSRLFKSYNTREHLDLLTDAKLAELGISRKDERKLILKAFRNGLLDPVNTKSKVKRKRDDGLSIKDQDEDSYLGSLDFKEVTDEKDLLFRSTVTNRAPIMVAWAMVVAESLAFKREEALSIASVYTEMNAISKGTSLGIIKRDKIAANEILSSSQQPHVVLMGRRIPLLTTKNGQWRALTPDGTPASPGAAFAYISNALRQTAPYIVGSMRLLAATFDPVDLNKKGFSIYASFRPEVEQWGARSTVKCKDILSLCGPKKPEGKTQDSISEKECAESKRKEMVKMDDLEKGGLTFDEYEALFDQQDENHELPL